MKQILSITVICFAITLTNIFHSQAQSYFPVTAKNGMVVSTNDISSEVGLEILKKGGNAVDAAVATGFALAVTYPSCGNIGGGGFMLIHLPNGKVTSIDFRIKAPALSTKDMFIDIEQKAYRKSPVDSLPILDSPLSVGIPGTVAGLKLAHKKYGKLSWEEVLKPAYKLALNGFPVGQALNKEMHECKSYFKNFPSSERFFLKQDKSVYEIGEIWKQPNLANTLKEIIKKGNDGFYNSQVTKQMVSSIQKYGGIASIEDFKSYEAVERAPVEGTYRGYKYYGMPLPSSGGITQLLTLNILENFDLGKYGHNSAMHLHLLAESFKCGFRERALYLGDSEFNKNIPVQKLISKDFAKTCYKQIDTLKASAKLDTTLLFEANEALETTHYSVIDSEGMGVSVTYSLGGDFGCYLVPEKTGVVLNNTMGDFNYGPNLKLRTASIGTKPNWIEPNKKPLSSMTPTILTKNNQLVAVLGSPGGPTIITTNVQTIVNLIDFKLNIAETVAAPRMFHGWIPDNLLLQWNTTTTDTQDILKKMGHNPQPIKEVRFGPVMGIWVNHETGLIEGACDPRSLDGKAMGY